MNEERTALLAERAGALGFLVWLVAWIGPEVTTQGADALVSRLLMFAPLTLVPWGIGLIARGERDVALLAWALRSWAPCSIAAVVSLYLPAGALAAGLSAASVATTAIVVFSSLNGDGN